jgi:hypothetical protein
MHSVQHHRERAAHVRRLAQSVSDIALREQLETVANDYDLMADELETPAAAPPP